VFLLKLNQSQLNCIEIDSFRKCSTTNSIAIMNDEKKQQVNWLYSLKHLKWCQKTDNILGHQD